MFTHLFPNTERLLASAEGKHQVWLGGDQIEATKILHETCEQLPAALAPLYVVDGGPRGESSVRFS